MLLLTNRNTVNCVYSINTAYYRQRCHAHIHRPSDTRCMHDPSKVIAANSRQPSLFCKNIDTQIALLLCTSNDSAPLGQTADVRIMLTRLQSQSARQKRPHIVVMIHQSDSLNTLYNGVLLLLAPATAATTAANVSFFTQNRRCCTCSNSSSSAACCRKTRRVRQHSFVNTATVTATAAAITAAAATVAQSSALCSRQLYCETATATSS
jgi:hypothetical protein